ncbi:hypothetical protein FE257_005832 [Aspergillus nanangensis]|uniref:Fumarylacetoacetase-like C-terminal domain-containing protein n=1 Tax=Aspergillus nanangensis TaxID=2582783 RepID=A0AAD4GV42_ASPNN|nr:hypothetical protein FE257_005832 [Aspergillus nanangensis]
MAFQRLVRFQAPEHARYGDLLSETAEGYLVQPLVGSIASGFQRSSEDGILVPSLLCPVAETPIIICVGLNYQQHAQEAKVAPFFPFSLVYALTPFKLTVPPYPVIFTKPGTALAGPHDPVHVHPSAQSMLDYEGELTFITARDAKNLPEDFDLADYILGYTAGNDVSARNFQLPEASGGQFCYAKSFDTFAPIGPAIVSPAVILDPQKLRYMVRVNGEIRQETGTDDMIWSVRQILRHITQGTTVKAGTVVMTGTPSGVGFFQKRFLSHGDTVEVEVEGVAKLVSTVEFES